MLLFANLWASAAFLNTPIPIPRSFPLAYLPLQLGQAKSSSL
jgi:hypothetical protein